MTCAISRDRTVLIARSKYGSKGRKHKGEICIYVTKHIPINDQVHTHKPSGNKFITSYYSLFKKKTFKINRKHYPCRKIGKRCEQVIHKQMKCKQLLCPGSDSSLEWGQSLLFFFIVLLFVDQEVSVWENWVFLIKGKGTIIFLPPKRS